MSDPWTRLRSPEMRDEDIFRKPLIIAGFGVAATIFSLVFPDLAPYPVMLKGAILGAGTGLMAVGLVLIYRTTRIINFAYGSMGGFAASVAVALSQGTGVPWLLALPVGVALGAVIGAAVERVVIRRFIRAPRLVLTVATIGLAQLFAGLTVFVPGWFNLELELPELPGFHTPLSDLHINTKQTLFDGNDFLLLGTIPIILGGLIWFLRLTDTGTAVRGMAENIDRARLLGIPVNRLSLLLWSIAGAVAALTVALQAPNSGISFGVVSGPTLLLPSLAAAVVARLRSLTVAFATGVGLGALDQIVLWNLEQRALSYVIFLAVIMGVLLVQRRPASRAEGADESSWIMVGMATRLPRELAALPEVRLVKGLGLALVAGFLVYVPLLGSNAQILYVTISLTMALAALSLVVLTGWGGVVSLGQFALAGVGGLVTVNLIARWNVDLFVTLAASAIAGGLVALLIGLPALRVVGQYLAITTLAFAVVMEQYIVKPTIHPDLFPGPIGRPQLWGAVELREESWLYLVTLFVVAGMAVAMANLRRARAGRSIAATRDNERGAAMLGVSYVEPRLTAFVVAGMSAGLAGALHMVALQRVGEQTYPAATSILVFSMAVIGGVSSIGGTLAGVALVQWLGYLFPRYQFLMAGVGLLILVMVTPGGLGHAYEQARDKFANAVWRRRAVGPASGLAVDSSPPSQVPPPPPAPGPLETPGPPGSAPPISASSGSVGEPGASTPPELGLGWDTGAVPVIGSGGDGNEQGMVGPVGPDYQGAYAVSRAARVNQPPLLRCEGVESSYGAFQVLFGIDTTVARGEMLALLGTNGAGKSTFLRSVGGLLPPDRGRIVFDGYDITDLPAERVAALGLSVMPGRKGVFPTLTVAENMRLAGWLKRRTPEAALAREDVLKLFPVLRRRWKHIAGDLSGGEQQQLSLAMALVTRPKLLCIDELSVGLAPGVVGQLVEKVQEIHRSGTAVVVVEQSVNVALLLADRAVFLEKGQVRFRGPTEGLLQRPDVLRAVFLGESLTTSALAKAAALSERPSRGVALQCRGLVKRFGGIRAVDGVDLDVPPGAILGLIGHNGAGKTTLFDVITGFLPADRGKVILGGKDITKRQPHRRAVVSLGRSFQEARLFPSLTVTQTLTVALERHLANRDPVAAALRLPASTGSERAALARAEELVDLLGLDPYRDRVTGELSTGTRRIVELGCLLAHDPAVVLLDEPSAGVAQREAEALVPLLRRVQVETGCSLVVIEHDMSLLSSLCDELIALEQGAIIAHGPPATVLNDQRVVSSYLGTDKRVSRRSDVGRPFGSTAPWSNPTHSPMPQERPAWW